MLAAMGNRCRADASVEEGSIRTLKRSALEVILVLNRGENHRMGLSNVRHHPPATRRIRISRTWLTTSATTDSPVIISTMVGAGSLSMW